MMRKYLAISSMFLMALGWFTSCDRKNNTDNPQTAQVSMRLTDDPGNYDAVYIDIRQIGFKMAGQSEILLTPNRPGVYNILSFRNGLDTLLVNATVPVGTVEQIRLILGNDNSIVVSGTNYPLSTPSAQESGLKLNFHTTVAANASYTIWIDFDAGKSILQTGGGNYKLKPVIRAYSALTNGKIEGYVLPTFTLSTVYAIRGSDTTTAIPTSVDGHFVMSGLPEGTYQLVVSPALTTYLAYSTTVNVSFGTITNVGTITLHP